MTQLHKYRLLLFKTIIKIYKNTLSNPTARKTPNSQLFSLTLLTNETNIKKKDKIIATNATII